jgi:hypothetical protein
VVLRERKGRTLPFVVLSKAEGAAIVSERVTLGTELHADGGPDWDSLEALTAPTGSTTPKLVAGTAPAPIRPKATSPACAGRSWASITTSRTATSTYANKAAWREDHCRNANGDAAHEGAGVGAALAGQPSVEVVLAVGGFGRIGTKSQLSVPLGRRSKISLPSAPANDASSMYAW